jgi:DTW domain-containing protein YfiP
LYVGTQKDSQPKHPNLPLEVRDRKGKTVPHMRLKGIVLLDGNWKQSKTLWWRNPWLLKLNRVILNPTQTSKYGTLRKQPRGLCLSTLEAGAESLSAVGETEAARSLLEYFEVFLGALAHKRAPRPESPGPSASPTSH